ncbi:MAG TPA: hypothetical protein VMT20_02155 [Terriglobia bacterium]|nr:hypothetical protein [Terriglobia bacterium]
MKSRLTAAPRQMARAGAAPRNIPVHPNNISSRHRHSNLCCLILFGLALALMAGCSSSGPKLTGPGITYQNAKDYFSRGHSANYDHALDALATLSDADPPNDYTDRARVLRAIILSGQFEGYKSLAEAYKKGSDKTTESGLKSEYDELYRDTLRRAGEISLTFAEAAMQLTKGGQIPKSLALDAPYPVTLASVSSATLDKVESGEKIGEDEQSDAALGAPGMGIAKMLSEVVGGDAEAVKSKMNAGAVPLDSAKFGLFLANELASSASLFDKKHIYDPEKYKQLANIAQNAGQAVAATLEVSPDPDTEKHLKELEDQLKAGLKASQAAVND